jgi:hypothetical protein
MYDKRIETTELFSLFISLFWNNLEAHCFHYFLTDSPTNQSENSETSELPDASKTVKIVRTVSFQILPKQCETAKTVMWYRSLCHSYWS